MTTGIVSALGRDVLGVGGRQIRGCIQTDAAINLGESRCVHVPFVLLRVLIASHFVSLTGNSGGPLLDSRGRLIGVNMAIVSPRGGGSVGIGFAIPVDTVRRVVNELIKSGRVVRPTMGVSLMDDRLVRAIEAQLDQPLEGVLVAEVFPNGPAWLAGMEACRMGAFGSIELGDLITHIDGESIRETEDLLSALEDRKEGETVQLRVLRNADSRHAETIKVELTSREKLPLQSAAYTGTRRG